MPPTPIPPTADTSGARPPRQTQTRSRWRWPRRIVGGLLLTGGAVFGVNYWRALYGDARSLTLAETWSGANLDSLAAVAIVEADTAPASVAPVVDSIAQAWVLAVNAQYPQLIVWSQPRPAGDLVVALNPMIYRTIQSPEDLGAWVEELAASWRTTLATVGVLWPDTPQFEPGIVIVRLTPAGDAIELVADSRDHQTFVADWTRPGDAPARPASSPPTMP